MNILILGSGGREHTFAWKITQSLLCKALYVAPGNSGTAQVATNVNITVTDFEAIKSFVLEKGIDMVVVGPEDPLVKGIHDFFLEDGQLKNVSIIGPEKAAAELEGSKPGRAKRNEMSNIYATFGYSDLYSIACVVSEIQRVKQSNKNVLSIVENI